MNMSRFHSHVCFSAVGGDIDFKGLSHVLAGLYHLHTIIKVRRNPPLNPKPFSHISIPQLY